MTERLDDQQRADKVDVPTPRTDEMWRSLRHSMDTGDAIKICEFCRQLERELSSARSAVVASVEPNGYAVIMDDPASAVEGIWFVACYVSREAAESVAGRHKARVQPIYFETPRSASERTGGECPTCGIDASFNDVRFIDAADTWTEEKLLVLDALDEIDALRRGVGVTHMAGHDPVQRLRQWLPKREQLELGKSIRAKVRAKWATNNPTDSRANRG